MSRNGRKVRVAAQGGRRLPGSSERDYALASAGSSPGGGEGRHYSVSQPAEVVAAGAQGRQLRGHPAVSSRGSGGRHRVSLGRSRRSRRRGGQSARRRTFRGPNQRSPCRVVLAEVIVEDLRESGRPSGTQADQGEQGCLEHRVFPERSAAPVSRTELRLTRGTGIAGEVRARACHNWESDELELNWNWPRLRRTRRLRRSLNRSRGTSKLKSWLEPTMTSPQRRQTQSLSLAL
jgi:hypothetical protein